MNKLNVIGSAYKVGFGSSSEAFTANVSKSWTITGPPVAGTYLVMLCDLVNESMSVYDIWLSGVGREYIGGASRVVTAPFMNVIPVTANQRFTVYATNAATQTSYFVGCLLFIRLS